MELPSYVQIEPVGQCNLRCQMCPITFRQDGPPNGPPAFMPFETFAALVDQFPNMETLHLQGLGEPMMHPRFFDMIAYAAERGVRVTTNTNLTLLNDERARRCVASGLAELHVSIDGASADTYERIRVRSRFERVIGNLGRLLRERARQASELPRLHLIVVIMRGNLHELPALVRLAAEWSIEEMFVQHLCHDFGETSLPEVYWPMRDFVDRETLLGEELERVEHYFALARGEAQRLEVKLRLPRSRPRPGANPARGVERCDWPWKRAYISYQGLAMPCCTVATPDRMNFGQATQRDFREVWESAEYEQFREQLNSDEPPEICRSCSVYHGTF